MRAAKGIVFCGVLLALLPGVARAEKFAGAFLSGGAGARALGMGNAYTAVSDDASGIYWNPAGLASTNTDELLLSHEFRFGNLVDYSFGGGIYQVQQRNGRLALGVIRLGIDNIAFPDSSLWTDLPEPGFPNGDGEIDPGEFNYDEVRDAAKVKMVSDAEYGIFLSYAQPVRNNQIGASLKLIRQSVGDFTSFGLGVDVGFLRHDVLPNLDVGLAVHDLTGTYLSWSTGRKETISAVPRLGLAYRRPSDLLRGLLLLTSDVEMHFDDRQSADQMWVGRVSANVNVGLEFTMENRLALRFGMADRARAAAGAPVRFQAGAGLLAGPVHFDYSIVPSSQDDLDLSQRLSLRYVRSR